MARTELEGTMKRSAILASLAMAMALAASPAASQTAPRMYAVKLAVSDFARTTEFYSLLGMQAGARHNEWEWELKWDGPESGSSIIMVRAEDAERFHVTPGGGTLIIGVSDVYAALAGLRAAGFDIGGEPRILGPAAIIMIQDPDGNWIELAGPAPEPSTPAED
jgi:catechol 2,3-dioxygenase-like lactoylglutathione lyase family enzyme